MKGRLTITPRFKCHSCLHLSENGNEVRKIKLGNVGYERMNKLYYLGYMLGAGSGAEASSVILVTTG